MAVKKICVLGLGKAGVPLGAVIAYKCPEIRVTVLKTNPDDVLQWNNGKLPHSVPGLEEFVRKCQNKNLIFTTNEVLAIKEAEIIFIASETRLKTHGEGENQAVDFTSIEEAGYLIADCAESSKIVVESSSIPLKSAECLKNVFKCSSKPGVEFQVLSNPEFYEHGDALRTLLFPDCVLIGSENTPMGFAAAKKVASIYERWVPHEKIVTMLNWSVELSKIATSVMAAQILANVYAISTVCEESGGDIAPLINLQLRSGFLDINARKFSPVLHNLVYMCEFINLWEVADYWRQVLEMFTLFQERFLKKFIWTLTQVRNKKITLFGFASYRDTIMTNCSFATDLCKSFLEEGAFINIYDPKVTKGQVIKDLKSAGCNNPEESLNKSLTVCEDPYKAAYESQAIVVCTTWPEFAELDYGRIFGEMMKPAYIFDRGQILPYNILTKIGFEIFTVGKST